MKGFSKPAVLLFGAGSTRGSLNGLPQPPPVDADFFDIAARLKSRGTGVLAKKVLKDVFSLYRRTSGVSLEEYYRDIEARGKIRVFTTQGHRHKDWETRKKELTELMRRVFIYTTTNMKDSPPTPRADDMHDRIFSLAQSEDTVI
ncbi:MAG: hypothetical protein HYZ88_00135, partial [Candidatus Omnitrophica bacterium]|nr:hypothetical protein [Candidatus Omnitrophota bacterium]